MSSQVWHPFLPNGSFFFSAKMFDPESRMEPGVQRDGAYFLDRDPAYFSIVLNYLRSGVLLGARRGREFYTERCSKHNTFGADLNRVLNHLQAGV